MPMQGCRPSRPFILGLFVVFTLLVFPFEGQTRDLSGRLGIGMADHFLNGIPAVSFKLQRSSNYAIGALLGLRFSTDDSGGYAGGIKFYRMIFDEPNLNFYSMGALSLINVKSKTSSETGFQGDLGLGCEFHFNGLESLGFSFEFGVTLKRIYDEFTLESFGRNLIKAAVHFYL